jgi:glycine cleavage system H lipoate-binding protein
VNTDDVSTTCRSYWTLAHLPYHRHADTIGAVESVKAASDIYAPVSGVVTEINEQLADQASLLNKKPETDGE